MKQKLQQLSLFLVTALVLPFGLFAVTSILATPPVGAQNLNDAVNCGSDIDFNVKNNCKERKSDEAVARCRANNPNRTEAQCREATKPSTKLENTIKTIINVFAAIVASVSVIMIIIGGFKYVTSGGDSNQATSARNTILYAIVGLIIVAFAQIIVRFVLQKTT